jgi:3-keto-5-aminohexanoate cleavage enzyme
MLKGENVAADTWRYGDTYEWMERLRRGFGPMIVTCALNGGVQGKESNPALPETAQELAAAAYDAWNAGAAAVHVHARDPQNLANCTQRSEFFLEINARIRERCPDLIINNTTGGGPTVTMEDRYEGLEARPELASLNLGPDMSRFKIPPRPAPLPYSHDGLLYDDCIPFTYGIVEQLARRMQEYGIKPEMELYQPGHFWVSRFVIEEGLVEPPYLHQFVMGYQTSSWPTPESLAALVRDLPDGSVYSVCGIGPFQLPMTTMSTLMGGHARVGLEDNIYYSRGRKFTGNGEAVERAVRIAGELNREVATPAQAREILGLGAPRPYGLARVAA